jgi:hypothetical protein
MSMNTWCISDLLQLSGGYWSASALHAGVKLDIFTQLFEGSLSTAELADSLGTDTRALEMLLNALTALELLKKNGDRFASTAISEEFLSRNSDKYVGHIILHHHNMMASWSRLDKAVRTGAPDSERISRSNDEDVRENFEMGMFNLAMQIAPQLVPFIDLSGRSSLLDLGGGPGTYAIHFCLHNPDLKAFVYDLPTTRPFAEKTIARFGLSDRISFLPGDFMIEDIQGRFDVAWLSHILHGAGPEGSKVILGKAMSALVSGGIIMIQEFILDDTMCSPTYPALFSLNMLLATPGGRSFSQSEISSMLTAVGARDVKRLPIVLPNGAGVISGTKP